MSEKTKADLLASTPPHEREARSKGIPTLGSGRIFPYDENTIKRKPFSIPAHWPRIAGLDIGWDHPTAVSWLAWDRDSDIIYLYDVYKLAEKTPGVHSVAIKARGDWIPVAWPHDALQRDKGSGKAIAKQYRDLGVNMLKEKASHAPAKGQQEGQGGNSVEAGLLEMAQRMETGRFKVFDHLEDWLFEYRLYHRKDGNIVKELDDAISSSRYAIMMLRHAKVKPVKNDGPIIKPFKPQNRRMGY